MTYAVIEGPEAEAISLAEVKAHLRLSDDVSEDDYLTSLIEIAREHLERDTGLCLMAQTWRLYLDDFPKEGVVTLARFPLRAIDKLVIFDAEGLAVDVTSGGHQLYRHKNPPQLRMSNASRALFSGNGAELDFIAGFGEAASDVPDGLKRAMLLHVAHMYAFRGATTLDDQPASIPSGYERLIAPFRSRGL
jgi:uncharacterized phiE125 gp8 family phage protein